MAKWICFILVDLLVIFHALVNSLDEDFEKKRAAGYVDGTWQRRGYSSMNGCVAALSVDTGKVDIEIMSSYCPTCRKRFLKMPRSIESETFAADHVCHSNFQGFALKMEAVGATRIFQRSIVKRGFKYAHYGDGDSKGFISVKKILYGRIASQNMNALVMFKRESEIVQTEV
ncbi:uncharacterized protein TNCV_4515751 [Trichonephila clavipes]|nr:uncharacterized protein TNCV_4515751 [Trichonephila clavipes]